MTDLETVENRLCFIDSGCPLLEPEQPGQGSVDKVQAEDCLSFSEFRRPEACPRCPAPAK